MLWPCVLPEIGGRRQARARRGTRRRARRAAPGLALGPAALGAVVAVPPPLLHAAKTNAAVPAKARSLLLSMLFLLLHWGIAVGDG